MPTVQKRVMLNIPEDTHAQLAKLSKLERRSMAQTCLLLIEAALKLPDYRDKLAEHEASLSEAATNAVQKEFGKDFQSYQELIPKKETAAVKNHKDWSLDSLTPEKIKEMQELLGMLEKLKS